MIIRIKIIKKILGNKPKIVIEAGSGYSWYKYLEQKDLIVSIDNFGESGKAKDLYNYFGFNCKNIVELIKKNNFFVITLKKRFTDITNFV